MRRCRDRERSMSVGLMYSRIEVRFVLDLAIIVRACISTFSSLFRISDSLHLPLLAVADSVCECSSDTFSGM